MSDRAGARLAIGLLAIVVFMSGLVAVAARHKSSAGPPHPDQWDPRVLDIVKFDEDHRGLKFKHPVFVDFLDAKAYSDRARTDQSKLDDKQKHQLEVENGELRAFGLSNSNVDLLQAVNDLQDTGTLAFYDPDSQHVIIRGTDITVDLKVTLVHEFTHVLQDQYFGVGRGRRSQFTTSQEDSAFTALVEGDAVRIENEFIDSLSDADKAAYQSTHAKEVDNAVAGLSNVPVALQAFQSAPYLVGPPFDELLVQSGSQDTLDAAFKDPPKTDENLIDPQTFLDKQKLLDVKKPSLPDGVSDKDAVDDGDFGALGLLVVLGERIDPLTALQAVDGWGGDQYVAYNQNGKTCVRLDVKGDNAQDDLQLKGAFDQWVAAMPAGAASVGKNGDALELQTCDPGADSGLTLNNRANDVLQLPATRSDFMLRAIQELHFPADKAFDFGNCVVRAIGFETFVQADKSGAAAGPSPELKQKVQSAIAGCR